MIKLPILTYLQSMISKSLLPEMQTHMQYPTAISETLGMKITKISPGSATVEIETKKERHGNQQRTIHGGLISELADAAIGTAHSTFIAEGESFTSIELKINFYRPVFGGILTAEAHPLHKGRNISHYICEIKNTEGKTVASATSTVMTLYGEKALGR